MTTQDFDPARRFVAGTVGPTGQRAFYLQVSDETRLVTVGLEKQQVAILSERIIEVLERLAPAATQDPAEADTDPLETPFDQDWTVQTLALSWNDDRGVLVIECHDHDPDELETGEFGAGEPAAADPAGEPVMHNSIRVVLTPQQAHAFAVRGAALVASGRPPCPFCGGPLDASGHICPRANGYRR